MGDTPAPPRKMGHRLELRPGLVVRLPLDITTSEVARLSRWMSALPAPVPGESAESRTMPLPAVGF